MVPSPVISASGLPPIFAMEAIRTADIPPRTWYWKPFLPVGLALIVGKKRSKKSFFAASIVKAIGAGESFLEYPTTAAQVLVIHTELDLITVHERLQLLGPHPDQAHVCFGWSWAEQALTDIDAAMDKLGYRVVVIDMMTAICMDSLDGYKYIESSRFFNRLRRIAQNHNATVVGLWHATKNARRDQLDEVLSSTGLVGQCDSVIMLRRKGANQVVLSSTGNHAQDKNLLLNFQEGSWQVERELQPEETSANVREGPSRCLELVRANPQGVGVAFVAANLNGGAATKKQQEATRKALDRLAEKGLLKIGQGHDGLKSYRPVERQNTGEPPES